MKRVVGGFLGSVVLAGSLYFGSGKLVAGEVDNYVMSLKERGFSVENLQKDGNSESFVITIKDAKKFTKYYPDYADLISRLGKENLDDLKLQVELKSSPSGISADIYPKSLPSTKNSKNSYLIKELIDNKKFLLHIDYNTQSKDFSGNLKDIDEDLREGVIKLKGFTFEGNSADDKLEVNYRLDQFAAVDKKSGPLFEIENVSSNNSYEGKNRENQNGETTIERVAFNSIDKTGGFSLKNIKFNIISDESSGMLDTAIKSNISLIEVNKPNDKVRLDGVSFDYSLKDIDLGIYDELVQSIEESKLKPYDPSIQQKVSQSLFKLLTAGMEISIDRLGVENIKTKDGDFGEASISLKLKAKNDPDLLQKIMINPILASSSLTIDSKIVVSDKIFAKIQDNPKGAMTAMFPPISKNATKIYNLSIKDGQMSINGQKMR